MKVSYHCDNCGNILVVRVGQYLIDNKIGWNASFTCPACKLWIEEDGVEEMPQEYRDIVIQNEGTWRLEIDDSKGKIPSILKILRKHFGLSMEEVINVKENISVILMTGTRTEMRRLQHLLQIENISTRLTKSN